MSTALNTIRTLLCDTRWEALVGDTKKNIFPPRQIHLLDDDSGEARTKVWVEKQGVHVQQGNLCAPYHHGDVDGVVAALSQLDTQDQIAICAKLEEQLECYEK